ncbi:MAG: M23 family metallopeptidase [Alphaproteobacteria bacterium]|nr:MAG: M23 family metallopeptidase [Alphaproteobacteria bacterium]
MGHHPCPLSAAPHSTILPATMMQAGKSIPGAIVALGLVLGLGACARSGPPAPLIDRSGAISPAAAPPSQARTVPAASAPRRAAPRPKLGSGRPAVTKAPLAARGRVTTSWEKTVRVQRGETLFAISRRHRIPLRALIDANGLTPPYGLAAGARLRVPAVRVYIVGQGDTVYGIARRFEVSPARLVRENRLTKAGTRLIPGQKLILPRGRWARGPIPARPKGRGGGRKPAPAAAAPGPTAVAAAPPSNARARRRAKFPSALPARVGAFRWPVRGTVLSTYGAKGGGLYNDGINIAARLGAPVRAAESGIVAYAGNELRGYGNLLLIRHSGGWVSAYAHTRTILVAKGQVVRRGQTIARVGRSGGVSRPQLHFELRRGPRAVDPMRYLGKNG